MPNKPFIPAAVVRVLVAVLALVAIVAFALIFFDGISDVLDASPADPPVPGEGLLYVSTAIASLVGGIVAVGFGVPLPANGPDALTNRGLLAGSIRGLGSITWPTLADVRQWIGAIYAIVYIIFGIAATVVWIAKADETSSLVKNLAMTFVGLVVPIVAAFARPNYDD